jgi:hypothetical protein
MPSKSQSGGCMGFERLWTEALTIRYGVVAYLGTAKERVNSQIVARQKYQLRSIEKDQPQ